MAEATEAYPILKQVDDTWTATLTVGKRWTDEQRVIQQQGFTVIIPKKILTKVPFPFAVTAIDKGPGIDEFTLLLQASLGSPYHCGHDCCAPGEECVCQDPFIDGVGIDIDGDVVGKASVSLDQLKRMTDMREHELSKAFDGVRLQETYELLALLPRILILEGEKVTLVYGRYPIRIKPYTAAGLILRKEHPLDGP